MADLRPPREVKQSEEPIDPAFQLRHRGRGGDTELRQIRGPPRWLGWWGGDGREGAPKVCFASRARCCALSGRNRLRGGQLAGAEASCGQHPQRWEDTWPSPSRTQSPRRKASASVRASVRPLLRTGAAVPSRKVSWPCLKKAENKVRRERASM